MTKNYTYNSNDVDAELVKKYLDGDSNAFTPSPILIFVI